MIITFYLDSLERKGHKFNNSFLLALRDVSEETNFKQQSTKGQSQNHHATMINRKDDDKDIHENGMSNAFLADIEHHFDFGR
jgi:hypothetical protein